MNPNALRNAIQQINATAGMEFELIIPDLGNIEDDSGDFDYDQHDEQVDNFYHIRHFFEQGDMNSHRDIESMVERLEDMYRENFVYEKMNEEFHNDAQEIVKEQIEYNMSWRGIIGVYLDQIEEVFDENEMEWDDDWDSDKIESLIDEHNLEQEVYSKCAEQAIEEYDRNFERARENWEQDNFDEIYSSDENQRDWLRSEGLGWMSDVHQNHGYDWDVSWPFMGTGDAEERLDDIAREFGEAVGKHVNIATSYHRGARNEGEYTIEPDGSLSGDNYDDGGLEFISPPMPLDEMFNDIDEIVQWAKENAVYTNTSTGLHMNVSIPNYSRENLDFVKLVLLMGDQYVLQQFDRQFNNYASSALKKVENAIRQGDYELESVFDQMKNKMAKDASKAIHGGYTEKFTSVNVKDGWVEFRSPGGDWLNGDIDKVKNTLMRFVVALDAACDPEKYRQEYLKKLYKLVSTKVSGQTQVDITKAFADYAAGVLDKAQLKQLISQRIQNTRDRVAKSSTDASARNTGPALADRIGAVYKYFQQYEVGSGRPISTNTENELFKIMTELRVNSQVKKRIEEILDRIESTEGGARASHDAVVQLSNWLSTQYDRL